MKNSKINYIFNGSLSFNAYTDNYNQKINNRQYTNFISPFEQFDLIDIYNYMNSNHNVDFFLAQIKSINTKFLYHSLLHGIYHSEKTLFFAYIISLFESLNNNDIHIVCDAAKYHDIGRNSDEMDYYHGDTGARLIDKVISNDLFYQHKSNLEMLKFLIHYHCLPSEMFNSLINIYDMANVKKAQKISDILKDADALDRVRLDLQSRHMQISPYYLKTYNAKKLIKVAHQVNEIYVIK